MKITKRTKTRDVAPFLNKESIEELIEKVPEVDAFKKSIMDMTIEEFSDVIMNEDALVEGFLKEKYLFNAIGKLKSYKRQMESITKLFKLYEIKQTPEEKQAAVGIVFPDIISKMMLTASKLTSLTPLEAAKKMLVQEYLMIYQDEASSLMYQRAYSDIINKQMKLKEKGKKKR